MIHHVSSVDEFNTLISSNRAVVVDFYADWCPPCRMIAPKFEELATTHTDIMFVKINSDEHQDIASQQEVQVLPTFQFFKDGKKIAEIHGANLDGLKQNLELLK